MIVNVDVLIDNNQILHKKVNVKVERNADGAGINLIAVDSVDRSIEIGKLVFHVEKPYNRIWLNSVKTDKHHQSEGVGKALLWAMEYIALRNYGISNVVGVFGPDKKYAKAMHMSQKKYEKYVAGFYERKGYEIDGYCCLKKNLKQTLAEYENKIDCSYAEMQIANIDDEYSRI